jgi:RNA polymerase sigma-70 factor, ECF subfamily
MHAEIIDLVYRHGKSVKEAARIVDVSEATVKMRTLYARRKLAQFLKDCAPMTIH